MLGALPGCAAASDQLVLQDSARIDVAGHPLTVELASTPEAREHGLMGRSSLPEDRGMLFVFPDRDYRAFWMKDTPLPLSIAFIADDGTIVNVADMAPLNETLLYRSQQPVRYALEVRQGWFSDARVGPGDRCTLRLPGNLPVR